MNESNENNSAAVLHTEIARKKRVKIAYGISDTRFSSLEFNVIVCNNLQIWDLFANFSLEQLFNENPSKIPSKIHKDVDPFVKYHSEV